MTINGDLHLSKMGVTVVRTDQSANGGVTILLRVKPDSVGTWGTFVGEVLLAASKAQDWAIDVSRVYYLDQKTGGVRYLWRMAISKNLNEAFEVIKRTVIECVASQVEVTSMPLYGRAQYSGTKGFHAAGSGERVVSSEFKT